MFRPTRGVVLLLNRGAVLLVVAVVTGPWALVPGLAAAQQPVEWPSFQGGPAHLGDAGTSAPEPPLRVRRRLDAGHGGRVGLSGAAVLQDVAVATAERRVIRFDPSTGTVAWSIGRARSALISPAIGTSGQQRIVVYTEGLDTTSAIAAADLASGRSLWRVRVKANVLSVPSIDGGRVFVGGEDQFVYALDLVTGRVVWKIKTEGRVDTSPAVADGRVFVVAENPTTGQARLYALDEGTGKAAWTFSRTARQDRVSSATVADGRVYVGFSDYAVRAFSAGNGSLLWSQPVTRGFTPYTAPATDGQSVLIADAGGGLHSLDARTGDERWLYQLPATNSISSPVVGNGVVFLGCADGTLGAVSISTGHLVWKTRLQGEIGVLSPGGGLLLASLVGSSGGLIVLDHDPNGHPVDEQSPSTLHLPIALANFGLAAVAVLLVVYGLFRLLSLASVRARVRTVPEDTEPEPVDRPEDEQ